MPYMDTRTLIVAGLLVGVGLALMVLMHEQHYRRRSAAIAGGRLDGRLSVVDARLGALERIVEGDHTL